MSRKVNVSIDESFDITKSELLSFIDGVVDGVVMMNELKDGSAKYTVKGRNLGKLNKVDEGTAVFVTNNDMLAEEVSDWSFDTPDEDVQFKVGTSASIEDSNEDIRMDTPLDGRVRVFSDGSIRFKPPFSKSQADYREIGDRDFDGSHSRCGSCSHFIENEKNRQISGCHVVQGEINPEDYCEEFYSDVGVFGHKHDDFVEINLTLLGENFDEWSGMDVDEFADTVEGELDELDGGEDNNETGISIKDKTLEKLNELKE